MAYFAESDDVVYEYAIGDIVFNYLLKSGDWVIKQKYYSYSLTKDG